jgi:PAS domain S-box-containing protein
VTRPGRAWRDVAAAFGVPAGVAVFILLGAAWFFLHHVPRTRREAVGTVIEDLDQRLDTRRLALERWIEEMFQDGAVIAAFPTVRDLLARPASPDGRDEHLRGILTSTVEAEGVEAAYVLDTDLRTVAASRPGRIPSAAAPVLRLAMDSARWSVDFVRDSGGPVRIVFAVPVTVRGRAGPVGAIVLTTSPSEWLYPFLAAPPLAAASAEALLARRDGDSVLFLSPLRMRNAAPLTHRHPAGDTTLAVALALRGRTGTGIFTDYRHVRVFAATTSLQRAPWVLVVKVDESDALARWRQRMWATALTEGSILLLMSLLIVFLWRALVRRHRLTEMRHRAHLATLLDQANDAMLFVELDGTIRSANHRAEEFYGVPPGGLVGRTASTLRPLRLQDEARLWHQEMLRRRESVFRTVHVAAGGREAQVEVSARRVQVGDDDVFVSVIRDIGERQEAEQRILRLNRMLRTLSEINQLMLRGRTAAQVLQEACEIAVEHGGFELAWIGVEQPDGSVGIAASAGKAAYLDGIVIRCDDTPQGRGPTGTALREDRTVTVDDLQEDPRFAPWRERAATHGLRSSAACPIRRDGAITGVLMLYAGSPRFFDAEATALLEELAGRLGFALRALEDRTTLRETEAKLAAFFHSPAIGMLFGTVHGAILDANDELLRIIGYTREELAAGLIRWDAITPPEFLPLDAQRIDEAVAKGVCTPYEKQYVRKDGTRVWVLVGFALLGEPRETSVAYVIDMTRQKQMEAELRDTERRFRHVVEDAPVGVLIHSGGAIRYANRTACRTFGAVDPSMLVGTPVLARVHPDDQAHIHARIARMLAGGEPAQPRDDRLLRLDGSEFLAEVEAVPIGFRGEPGAMVFLRDVTAQRRAAQEQALVTAALEQSAEVAVITDADGTIVYVNPAFERVTGYARAEALGQNPRILKSGHQDAAFYERLWSTLTAGRIFTGTIVNRKKSGECYIAEVSISPIRDDGGRITRYLGLQRDVTREQELEEQLRQSQKMDAVGRLTGGVAHDFNNLLGVVLANAAVLRRDLPPERGDLMDYVDDIIEAATGGGTMVRKLLAFSRRERLTPETVDLVRTLEETERTLQRFLPETIRVSVTSAASPLAALLDTTAFDQIMLNLATNARDAMPEGGTLIIRAAEVEALDEEEGATGAGRSGRYACVEVTDTGHGMDAETLSHVFEPFFTTKPAGAGTGLGLPMVFGLMRQLGGFVRISSSPDAGTIVRLYFRTAAGATPVPAAPRAASRPARQGAGTILVVEDQERLRRATARALGRLGYAVVVAADAAEALTILKTADPPIDLVLSDLVMPGISGAVLYERLRAEGRMVPFLLMSGYASGTGEAMQVPEGVALIMKPWSLEALDARIRDLMGRPAS